MTKMKSTEYRKLCKRIYKEYKKKLNLLYIDACELADLVYWGKQTEQELFEILKEME